MEVVNKIVIMRYLRYYGDNILGPRYNYYSLFIYLWDIPVPSFIKTGLTSKLAARIDFEGTLEDKGPSRSMSVDQTPFQH